MNSPDPVPAAPAAADTAASAQPSRGVPDFMWILHSKIFVGLTLAIVGHFFQWLNTKYKIDLTAFGITQQDVVTAIISSLSAYGPEILQGIGAALIGYGRWKQKAAPKITLKPPPKTDPK